MKVIETKIPDVKIIEPEVFGDERGFFMETWNQEKFEKLVTGKPTQFVQDNHSISKKGTLRGLHYQIENSQGKLVRVVSGEIYDVVVDLRKSSPMFGQWIKVLLSAENKKQLWVPKGFAHGFVTLTSNAECLYKTTNFYSPEHERTIIWNDVDLCIDWGIKKPILSDSDKIGTSFNNADYFE